MILVRRLNLAGREMKQENPESGSTVGFLPRPSYQIRMIDGTGAATVRTYNKNDLL